MADDYVVTFENDGGELTFSESGLIYSFVGRATFVGITAPGDNPTSSFAGYSTYTIVWPGEIAVVLPVKANGATLLRGVTRTGNTWTINVYKGSENSNSLGFDIQEQTEVYVFGMPSAEQAGEWGLFLFDDAGNITADLSRRPLTFKARIATADPHDEWPFPPGSYVPAILGSPGGGSRYAAPGPNNLYNIRESVVGWQINSSTGRLYQSEFLSTYRRDDAPGSTYTLLRPSNAILIDVTGI